MERAATDEGTLERESGPDLAKEPALKFVDKESVVVGEVGSHLRSNAPVFTPSELGTSKLKAEAPAFVPFNGRGGVVSEETAIDPDTKLSVDGLFVCSIDVECVATGIGNKERTPARVALVDVNENVLFDKLIKPKENIVSLLTPLTGLQPGSLDNAGTFEEVRKDLLKILPKNALLIGQAIDHDINWMQLKEGTDFYSSFDVGKMFRVFSRTKRHRYFSLRHEVLYLTGFKGAGTDIQSGIHDPVTDAIFSLRLFKRFMNATVHEMKFHRQALMRAPQTEPFWKKMPLCDGVQLGPAHIY